MAPVAALAVALFLAGHPWPAAGLVAVAALGPHAHNWLEATWWATTWRVRLAMVLVPAVATGTVFVSGWLALTLAAWGTWRVLLAALRDRQHRPATAAVPVAVVNNQVTVNHHYHQAPRSRRSRRPLVLALAVGRRAVTPSAAGAIDVTEATAAIGGPRAALPAPTADDAIPTALAATTREARP